MFNFQRNERLIPSTEVRYEFRGTLEEVNRRKRDFDSLQAGYGKEFYAGKLLEHPGIAACENDGG
jgi:hypothetical protein